MRVRDLERIVSLGAELGWELFAHPDEWEVNWMDGEREGVVVVFPALVKTEGKEVVCEAEKVEVGGST